jgi:hypothetical protein
MRKLVTLALLAMLGACTNYAATATPEAAKAWEKSLPPSSCNSNCNGNGSIKHVSSTPIQERMTFPELGPTWTNPPLPPSSIGGMPRSNYTSANASSPAASAMPHGAVSVDCPEIDPAQARCSAGGSGWTY